MRKAAVPKTCTVAPAKAIIAADSPAVVVGAQAVAKTPVKPAATAKKRASVVKTVPAASALKAVETAAPKRVRKAVLKTPAVPEPAAEPTIKPAAKPVVKRAARKTAAPVVIADVAPDVVRERAHKTKLVRDSFTMPEHEYAVLGQVKKACLKAGFEIKKSELLRIGVALISQLDLATLQSVLAGLPQLKTGRPNKV